MNDKLKIISRPVSKKSETYHALRKCAENILEERAGYGAETQGVDLLHLIHELEAHQMELELQNEELRLAQKNVKTYRNQYDDLYDSAPVGFVTLTPKGLVERVNRAAEALIGSSGEVLIGKGFSRWIHLKDHDIYYSCLRKAIDVGVRQACALHLGRKSGSLLYARIEAGAHFDEAGNMTEWCLTISDIPAREEGEQALRQSEQHLRDVLNNIVAIIGVMAPDGTLIEASSSALQAANLQSEDVLGKPFEECYWWAWSPEVQKRLCEAMEMATAGKGSRYDEVVRVAEGEFRTIDFKLTPTFGPDNHVSYLIASATGITRRKQSEEKLCQIKDELESSVMKRTADLEKQKKLLQEIMDNIPVMIAFYNAENFLYFNRTALDTIGIASQELKSVNLMERCYPDSQYRKEVIELITKDPPEWKEIRMVVKDGEEIATSWFNRRLADGSYVGTAIDITQRKTAEGKMQGYVEKLERSNKLLGKLSSELTLSEQRERHRLAEVLQGNVVQLLVGAKTNCEVLSAQIGPEHKQAAETMLGLITQSIRTLRSLAAEISPPFLHRGRLSTALRWLVRWMQENHGLTIELKTDNDRDPEREDITVLLYLSIRELLFNVVKHAGVKSAWIEMSRDKENRFRVAVTDRGSGFDPATIWEKAQSGNGSGLFSIRERLTLLGGTLEVESSPGNGAAFLLLVPLETTRKKDGKSIQKIITRIHRA